MCELNDLNDRLSALAKPPGQRPSADVIAEDLRRGAAALKRRRARRASFGAAVAMATLGVSVAVLGHPGLGDPAPKEQTKASRSTGGALALVAYHGKQLPGFKVRQIPAGYVLQGSTANVLAISKPGDHSSVDDFRQKLVVTVTADTAAERIHGARIEVGGHQGALRTGHDGVTMLQYRSGKHLVNVQAWSNVRLTREQVVRFAEGITVTGHAENVLG
jgi:hypothetical protein